MIVVDSGLIESRNFAAWSMAFVGSARPNVLPMAKAVLGATFAKWHGAGTQILAMLQTLVVQENDWILADS